MSGQKTSINYLLVESKRIGIMEKTKPNGQQPICSALNITNGIIILYGH